MKQILPGVYTFTGLPVGRVYLIEDPDGLTLIDTSVPPAAGSILKQIQSAGHKPQDIKRILITHGHPDHTGSLAKIKHESGAQVIASEIERPVIEGKIPVPVRLKGFHPPKTMLRAAQVDRTVVDGEMLPEVMGGLQVVFTPGHAPGHISFWQPQKRVLFTGDVIFNLPRLTLPWAFLTVDMEEDKRSIKKLVELNASVVCFGHGQPITENASEKLRAFAVKVGAM